MLIRLSRRDAMRLATGLVIGGAAASLIDAAPAQAANDSADVIKAFTGGKTPTVGRVRLEVPEIAENGNTVPMAFAVEGPMTDDDYVTDVLVVADENPRAGVATFHFTALSGVAEGSTRIRLAQTQNVVAVAKTSKGAFFMDTKQVKVTIGGCGG
jgi:sulfur-oxidizing protein SoxY